MGRRQRLRSSLRQLLALDEPPERTARTYGFGVFLGFSPIVGFRTLVALALMFLIPMNRLALLAGVYTNVPWIELPALALGTGIGLVVMGSEATLPVLTKDTLSSGQFWSEITTDAWNLLLPFLFGNIVLSLVLGLVGYLVLKRLLLRYRSVPGSDNVATP